MIRYWTKMSKCRLFKSNALPKRRMFMRGIKRLFRALAVVTGCLGLLTVGVLAGSRLAGVLHGATAGQASPPDCEQDACVAHGEIDVCWHTGGETSCDATAPGTCRAYLCELSER